MLSALGRGRVEAFFSLPPSGTGYREAGHGRVSEANIVLRARIAAESNPGIRLELWNQIPFG